MYSLSLDRSPLYLGGRATFAVRVRFTVLLTLIGYITISPSLSFGVVSGVGSRLLVEPLPFLCSSAIVIKP